jgi:hypothetical protein
MFFEEEAEEGSAEEDEGDWEEEKVSMTGRGKPF